MLWSEANETKNDNIMK